uniref:Uncharacterized protein n=1 Tax=Meloidogyne floridensis TaxID=298350 RepID=A0A915NBX0_9BILA
MQHCSNNDNKNSFEKAPNSTINVIKNTLIIQSLKSRAIETIETPAVLRATTLENVPTPWITTLKLDDEIDRILASTSILTLQEPPLLQPNGGRYQVVHILHSCSLAKYAKDEKMEIEISEICSG